MTGTDRTRGSEPAPSTAGPLTKLVFVFAGLAILALCALSFEIYRDLVSLRATSRDNVSWAMAQLEVEYLRTREAIGEAAEGEAPLSDVRRRFDIFYSRTDIIANSPVFSILQDDAESDDSIHRIVTWFDRMAPFIDGTDEGLRAHLNSLGRSLDALAEPVRKLALTSVRLFANEADESRADFSRLLLHTAIIAVLLIVLLGFLLGVFVRQNRIAAAHLNKLRLSSQRFEQTINGSINAVVVTDEDGVIVEFNPSAERVFGHPRERALGRNVSTLLIPERHRDYHARSMTRFKETGVGAIIGNDLVETDALHADGHELPVELALTHTTGPDSGHFVAYIRDITKRRADERELIETRDRALAAARAKSDFLAVMSHEMRTPLNGVLAILDLLDGTELDARQREYVKTAITSGEILQHHIDGVLDLTRMETGRFSVDRKPFEMPDLLAEIARIGAPIAQTRGNVIEVVNRLPGTTVVGDRHRIGQILLNLVSNAIKFTEGGRIEIVAWSTGARANGRHTVSIAVHDTGIGIAAADLERVFDSFVTLDPSFQRAADGSGLGLSICRNLARAMGGDIAVRSEPGRGSTFTVTLPLEFRQTVQEPPPQAASAEVRENPWLLDRKLDVLLVEDNLTNRFAAREMLSRHGCEVTEAQDGLVGLRLSEQRRYDFILMDVSMPRMDGIESTRAIRAGDGASAKVPIIGLTAHQLSEVEDELLAAGMNCCLDKPLRIAALRSLLERLFSESPAHAKNLPENPRGDAFLPSPIIRSDETVTAFRAR